MGGGERRSIRVHRHCETSFVSHSQHFRFQSVYSNTHTACYIIKNQASCIRSYDHHVFQQKRKSNQKHNPSNQTPSPTDLPEHSTPPSSSSSSPPPLSSPYTPSPSSPLSNSVFRSDSRTPGSGIAFVPRRIPGRYGWVSERTGDRFRRGRLKRCVRGVFFGCGR